MPRVSLRRKFINKLRKSVTQRQSMLVAQMLLDNIDSNDSSSSSGSSSNGDIDDSSSTANNIISTINKVIFAAGYASEETKMNFAESKRYLFRQTYRKSNEDVFINDLNTGTDGERPWMTEEEFKQRYRLSRDALDHIYELIKDHKVFKNKRGRKQMHPKHQLMVLLQYLGTEGSGANNPSQRAYFRIGRGSTENDRRI